MSVSSGKQVTTSDSLQLTKVVKDAKSPVLFRSLVAHWPSVRAGLDSDTSLQHYICRFATDLPIPVFEGEPHIASRPFYNDDFTGMNFTQSFSDLPAFFDKLNTAGKLAEKPLLYMGSTNTKRFFPGFEQQNSLEFGQDNTLTNLWMGNQSCIAAHFDFPENLACCVAGQRRVTLFPPDQLENLYIGPLDKTPAGQPISLVNPNNPDFSRFPKYKIALSQAIEVDLSPGDVLFIPSMWWHQVNARTNFNVLYNYWWKKTPAYLPSPTNALNCALLTIKNLPKEQKKIWQSLLNYYVFEENNFEHIPQHVLGPLGEIDEVQSRKLRAILLDTLNH